MRDMNKTKRRWPVTALACALVLTAMLAASSAWARTVTVRNGTDYRIQVVAFEKDDDGILHNLGRKTLTPWSEIQINSHGKRCLARYRGEYLKGSSNEMPPQTWEQDVRGFAACTAEYVLVRLGEDGKFYFKIY